jgi:hypothetical protein
MDFLTDNSYKLLASHHKAFAGKRGDNYDKLRATWNKDTLHMVGVLRSKLLAAGFVVEFINDHDELVFGVMLKSGVQRELENGGDWYYQRGLEVTGGDVKAYLAGLQEAEQHAA